MIMSKMIGEHVSKGVYIRVSQLAWVAGLTAPPVRCTGEAMFFGILAEH